MLEVRMLGAFGVKSGTKSVALTSRSAQSLFAYLIHNAGVSHGREQLADQLWPDSREEATRGNWQTGAGPSEEGKTSFGTHARNTPKNTLPNTVGDGVSVNCGHRSGTKPPAHPIEEKTMSTKRISAALLVAAAIVVAAVTMSLTGAKALRPLDDFALRHPEGLSAVSLQPSAYYAKADYSQRHPELSRVANAIDTSDYFLRHPEWAVSVSSSDASDFFLRHPDWTGSVTSIDSSDYFLRHPELIITETDDYALRYVEQGR
jgi:hypothetical protein